MRDDPRDRLPVARTRPDCLWRDSGAIVQLQPKRPPGRATLSELAEQVKAGAEKIITKNGASYVALIDADRLDYYHRLERERIHLLLIDDARRGRADIAAGRTQVADAAIAGLQARRTRAQPAGSKVKVKVTGTARRRG